MISWKKPTSEMVESVLTSVKKETDRQYFFSKLNNPLWVEPLRKRGYFNSPPGMKLLPNGYVQYPYWPELAYLVTVAGEATDQVINIVLALSETDNPRVYDAILSMALKLKGGNSARLLPKLIEYAELDNQFLAHRYPELLQHWVTQGNINEVLELVKRLIPFRPDPRAQEKQRLRKNNPHTFGTLLEPIPRFDQWTYLQILDKGVRPLSDKVPYQVADILIHAIGNMIQLGVHQKELDKRRDEDLSNIWCRRLDKPEHNYPNAKESLVRALRYACEQVYANAPDSVEELDKTLRKQRWKVFTRLRQHLYARYPNDQTLPWIREFILGHADYGKWEHHFEFQLMIRKATEHFGTRLLTQDERSAIFDKILQGPPKEDFRKWMGERYSEENYQKRQRYFHRMQLRPFAALLNEEIRRYFDELEAKEQAEVITDESYSPYGGVSGGTVSYRSPRPVEYLEKLTDRELLTYLNDWNEEHRDKDDWLVEVNISALADVFKSLFKDNIVADGQRLMFWMAHRDEIARPIYVAAMIKTMQEIIKEKNFDNLQRWIEFSSWVLSHPESERIENQPEPQEESCDHPDWGSSRRAVVDFIDACVSKDTGVPLDARAGLAKLIEELCNQFDWRLDQDRPVLLNRDDPFTEAINNTRSRALLSLVNFGFWIRRHIPSDPVSEVTTILSGRLVEDAKFPLTGPEFALLGMQFGNLFVLNKDWAVANRVALFPKGNKSIWWAAFGSYLRFKRPFKAMFEILRSDFEYALENIKALTPAKGDEDHVATLGQHLFTYYLWELFPLTGTESLLERFYEKTSDDRKRWSDLFDHVGRSLSNSGKHLGKSLTDRATAYFDWRLKAAEPLELQEFEFWLEAECFDPEWRLRSYAKVLEYGLGKDVGLYLQIKALNKLLTHHLPLVVECFAKITDGMDQNTQMYISADDSRPILKAGLKSEEPQVRKNAERARENLLKLGRFDYLDLDEGQN